MSIEEESQNFRTFYCYYGAENINAPQRRFLPAGHTIRPWDQLAHRNQGHRTAEVTKHCLGDTAWPR